MTEAFDVLVVGGGPAGLATAGALARAGRRVALFERSAYAEPRVGETFGPEVGSLLRELGAWDWVRDLLEQQAPFSGVLSAWGSGSLVERSSILNPFGEGWHLDRVRFDQRLAEWASSVGVRVRTGVGRAVVERDGPELVVRPSVGAAARGRFLVDASGRGAPVSAQLGARRWLAHDRQVALVARMAGREGAEIGSELLLEAVEDGWWYSVPQTRGALVVVLLTDSDLLLRAGRDVGERFRTLIAKSAHTALRTRGLELTSRVRILRADSGRLIPDRGEGWRAVGDASSGTDPLGGNGVARALRSALDASRSLEAAYDARAAELEFAEYTRRRAGYYSMEKRWPDAPFWARRQPLDWRAEPLTLSPEALLRWVGAPAPQAEALLPPRAIAGLREALRTPQPAHVALSRLRDAAPLADRCLLVGLQLLVECGAITAG